MSRQGFYFNQDACSGCRACQTSCKDRNDLGKGVLYRHVTTYQTGSFPKATMYHVSATCNHCDDPACVRVCPTYAMHKTEDGTVQHDDTLCVGCRMCTMACPYNVPQYKEDEGIVGKCDACKPYRDAGENPVCVDACNMRCLEFGDVDELIRKHGDESLVHDLPVLPTSEHTHPTTQINPKTAALENDYREVLL